MFIVLKSSITITPDFLIITLASTADLEAVPPTWNVLRVSCVPGSPIDCVQQLQLPLLSEPSWK